MKMFRESVGNGLKINTIANKNIEKVIDYNKGIDGLPKSNVLKYILADGCSVVVRPSGTEPKIKIYLSVLSDSKGVASNTEKMIMETLQELL